ncbi:hypothetical protein LXL04_003325 [Taraxacum kok-saghyz]
MLENREELDQLASNLEGTSTGSCFLVARLCRRGSGGSLVSVTAPELTKGWGQFGLCDSTGTNKRLRGNYLFRGLFTEEDWTGLFDLNQHKNCIFMFIYTCRPATGVAAPVLEPAVKPYKLLHDILSPEVQNKLYSYFQCTWWNRNGPVVIGQAARLSVKLQQRELIKLQHTRNNFNFNLKEFGPLQANKKSQVGKSIMLEGSKINFIKTIPYGERCRWPAGSGGIGFEAERVQGRRKLWTPKKLEGEEGNCLPRVRRQRVQEDGDTLFFRFGGFSSSAGSVSVDTVHLRDIR